DFHVTGVQTCALPISPPSRRDARARWLRTRGTGWCEAPGSRGSAADWIRPVASGEMLVARSRDIVCAAVVAQHAHAAADADAAEIGRASWRERGERRW